MQLPNYFLGDLPPEATLNAEMISEACEALRRNRDQYLSGRSTAQVIGVLSEIGRSWMDAEYPFRKWALEQGPSITGFSRATLARGIDEFFSMLTADNLSAWIEQDLGNAARLDQFCASPTERKLGKSSLAVGPSLLAHITGGLLPNPVWMNLITGVLLRSAQFVKCARGASFLPRMFAHSIYELDSKLGASIEIAEWPGERKDLTDALFATADCVTATGSDETVQAIRHQVRPETRWAAYGHRLSFGFVSRSMLSASHLQAVISAAADDVTAWDQLGCLSPHLFYVEHGGASPVERVAELLAAELEKREAKEPRRTLSAAAAAELAARRSFYEVRSAHSPETTRHWFSAGSTAWSVIFEADPLFQGSCLNRFIYVKAVRDLEEALQGADAVRRWVSTMGVAAGEDEFPGIASRLARWGALRICPLGQMQRPSLSWRHDGRPALGELVRWVEREA